MTQAGNMEGVQQAFGMMGEGMGMLGQMAYDAVVGRMQAANESRKAVVIKGL